jgi:hypothetical protein
MIRYSTSAFPASATEGTAVENGSAGKFSGSPASADSFVHKGLTNGVTHYYSIFGYDEVPNYSSPATATALPVDVNPPRLSISVFQNPLVTNHLDICITASEAIVDTSLHCTVKGSPLDMTVIAGDEHAYMGNYDLYSAGPLSIRAVAEDPASFRCDTTRNFSSSVILASSGGAAASTDGRFEARFGGGLLQRDAYILISEAQSSAGTGRGGPPEYSEGSRRYEVSPGALDVSGFVRISIAYGAGEARPEHLCFARLGPEAFTLIDSYLDRERGRIVAYVDRLGTYCLVRRPGAVTPGYSEEGLRVLQNVPNPFAGSTTIVFDLMRGSAVEADVISVEGRRIRTLMSGSLPPGRHSVTWDGKDSAGRPAASGIYMYRFRSPAGSVTKKMVVLR